MNKLTSAKRAAIVAALVEGNSMRATCRMTGVSLPTVTKLLRDLGEVCARYQDAMLRHLTRLTNGFSKKVENHAAAVALHFAHYNFCRLHKTTRVTPAMAAGVSDHVWGLDELIGLVEIAEEIKCVA